MVSVSGSQIKTCSSTRALLSGIIDYAGLFPPAALDMGPAVERYVASLSGDYAWMLGRFIVPVGRLQELKNAYTRTIVESGRKPPGRLSVLADADPHISLEVALTFNAGLDPQRRGPRIEAMEMKASTPEEVRSTVPEISKVMETYVEIPIERDPAILVDTIAGVGARAKVRTGGTQESMFPQSAHLLRFIAACVERNVPFKATAGLHHAIRSVYRLTYNDNSSSSRMYGFLNVFLASAFLKQGMKVSDAIGVLEEESLRAFRFEDDAVVWRGNRITTGELSSVRSAAATSFGSCSIQEPIDDLIAAGLI